MPSSTGANLERRESAENRYEHDRFARNLSTANLHGADLRTADMSGANLMGANLEEANLTDANLNLAVIARAGCAARSIKLASTLPSSPPPAAAELKPQPNRFGPGGSSGVNGGHSQPSAFFRYGWRVGVFVLRQIDRDLYTHVEVESSNPIQQVFP